MRYSGLWIKEDSLKGVGARDWIKSSFFVQAELKAGANEQEAARAKEKAEQRKAEAAEKKAREDKEMADPQEASAREFKLVNTPNWKILEAGDQANPRMTCRDGGWAI